MPVYKPKESFKKALESICDDIDNQGELLLLDDGNSPALSEQIDISTYPCKVRIHQNTKNMGIAKSLNAGLNSSHAEYILRMDADDVNVKGRIRTLVDFLDTHKDISIVGCRVQNFKNDGTTALGDLPLCDNLSIKQELIVECAICHPTVAFRRVDALSVGGYPTAYSHAEDYALWLRLAEKFNMANITDVLYQYDRSDNTHTGSSQNKMLAQFNIFRIENLNRLLSDSRHKDVFFPLSFFKRPLKETLPHTMASTESKSRYQQLLYRLGILMMKKSDSDLADKIFTKALEISPHSKISLFKFLNRTCPRFTCRFFLSSELF